MTTAARPRSPDTSTDTERGSKRSRPAESASSGSQLAASIQVPSAEQLKDYRQTYQAATPYRHAVIPALLSDELLEGVVEEAQTYGVRGEEGSLPGWGWEQKETDIYKIQQTPDLSSLDPEHLPDETLKALPYSTKLKNALYLQEFRNLVREVTGCGPLSGKRKDLSAGLYTEGSHLLLHDDSISTRLISFILYLPNSPPSAPSTSSVNLVPSASGAFLKGWDPAWGGALELYPVENGEEVGLPGVKRAGKVDVKWGQIVFFEVQPGRSYHSVEEVVIGEGRQRLGVSGWFHRPVEGEEGFAPMDDEKKQKDLSSLAQITSAPTIPFTSYTEPPPPGLTPSHLNFLKDYLAPSYLTTSTLEKLSGQFVEASEIVLHNFLHPDLAAKIKSETENCDKKDNVTGIPAQDLGEGDGWSIQGPTSKHRYLSLAPSTPSSTSSPAMQAILSNLLPSSAFRAWLSVVSSLAPTSYRTEARRFRKGLDYTLAAGEDKSGEARLDVWLGCTWWAEVKPGSDEDDELVEHGGWECYLAAPDEHEDPAVFQSAHAKKRGEAVENGQENGEKSNGEEETGDAERQEGGEVKGEEAASAGEKKAGPSISVNGTELEFDPDQFSPSDFDSDSDDGDEDDGPLLTLPVGFNKLLLVLRDPGVMRFVKYLSAGAKGSRWDVGGEWEVGVLEEEDEEDGDEDEAKVKAD